MCVRVCMYRLSVPLTLRKYSVLHSLTLKATNTNNLKGLLACRIILTNGFAFRTWVKVDINRLLLASAVNFIT